MQVPKDTAIIKITNKMQHIENRYRLDMVLPSKLSQIKLCEINVMNDDNYKEKTEMYEQILEYYLVDILAEITECEINDWETKQVKYKPTEYYNKLINIFECDVKEPCRFKFYFYTDEPIKIKNTIERLKDKILVDFGSDYLAFLCDISRIEMLPHEGNIKTIKIPLKPLIEKLEKETCETSQVERKP